MGTNGVVGCRTPLAWLSRSQTRTLTEVQCPRSLFCAQLPPCRRWTLRGQMRGVKFCHRENDLPGPQSQPSPCQGSAPAGRVGPGPVLQGACCCKTLHSRLYIDSASDAADSGLSLTPGHRTTSRLTAFKLRSFTFQVAIKSLSVNLTSRMAGI